MSYQVGHASTDEQLENTEPESSSQSFDASYVDALILEHRENGRKLARSMLRRWRAHMNAEEVDSIVDLTLCEAAQRFDPENGASFMTFYFYHLRGFLVRAVANAVNSSNVVLAFGADAAETAPAGTDLYTPSGDYFEGGSRDAEGPESIYLKKENARVCEEACAKLDELEREVITRSFRGEEALVDIAKSLGYSRCHISRVKKRALERLQLILTNQEGEETIEGKGDGFTARDGEKPKRTRRRRRSRRRKIASSDQAAVETVHRRRA